MELDEGALMVGCRAASHRAIPPLPDERGGFIEVGDPLTTPVRAPVIGERLTIVHPAGYPGLARIPYPWFRGGVYAGLGYLLVVCVLGVTGLG
tara:strand:- start:20551 stop:20829 length:279 start_codon:yes stop_codon:yes gene_type:complete